MLTNINSIYCVAWNVNICILIRNHTELEMELPIVIYRSTHSFSHIERSEIAFFMILVGKFCIDFYSLSLSPILDMLQKWIRAQNIATLKRFQSNGNNFTICWTTRNILLPIRLSFSFRLHHFIGIILISFWHRYITDSNTNSWPFSMWRKLVYGEHVESYTIFSLFQGV